MANEQREGSPIIREFTTMGFVASDANRLAPRITEETPASEATISPTVTIPDVGNYRVDCHCPSCLEKRRQMGKNIKTPKFKIDDLVKLTTNKCVDSMANPRWGGQYGNIIGNIRQITPYITVLWENGVSNVYGEEDLEKATNKEVKFSIFHSRKPIDPAKVQTIKIQEKLHNQFVYDLEIQSCTNGLAIAYLLGKNKRGIINTKTLLQQSAGCDQMPTISAENTAKALLKISKKGIIPCGLIRIGANLNLDETSRGPSLHELGFFSEGAFIISFTKTGIKAETYCILTAKIIKIPYAIVK